MSPIHLFQENKQCLEHLQEATTSKTVIVDLNRIDLKIKPI
jgi:hypothetical protein